MYQSVAEKYCRTTPNHLVPAMHREFDATDNPFKPRLHLGLYLLTAILAALLIADLWPLLCNWLGTQGLVLPTWPTREFYGYRFALIAAMIGGARVVFATLEKLAVGKVGADMAVAIACIAAIVMGEPLIAAEVVFIGLFGECLEAITFDRTQRALGSLSELFPQRTWVLRDGQEVRTFTQDVLVGDTVVVKPGGRIPVDGPVQDGQCQVDVSALTGESIPRDVQPGDAVLAGSIVLNGSLTILAEKVNKQTTAGRVIELTGQALQQKMAGERLADVLARYFLPIVLGLALLTFLFNIGLVAFGTPVDGKSVSWWAASRVALYPTLAVLVVACPCPLVLATPAALIAALGRLAGTGILIKSGAALERLAKCRAFAFDKTGTLTEGKLELGAVLPFAGEANELLRVAASAEQPSEHPLARAVVQAARSKNLALDEAADFTAVPGGGIRATVNGVAIRIGTTRFLQAEGLVLPDTTTAALTQFDELGQTALFVAKGDTVIGAVGLSDRLRPEAFGVLTDLQDLGFEQRLLLTGDRQSIANAMGKTLPLTMVAAELLPPQKAEYITENTAFIGDGINDAPALAKATVGIAVGTGTDLAAEAGDIIMMGEPLRPLPLLVRLSRETVRVIRQNIIWFGFVVNGIGVLLSGLLWPLFATSPDWYEKAPLVGVIYHQIGSLAVLLNSMRLLAFERTASTGLFGSIRRAYQTVDRGLAQFHIDDALHEVVHYYKPIALGSAAIALSVWLATGFTFIAPQDVGVCQRFGAVQRNLEPGLHYRWPWPIEKVTRVKPLQVQLVPLGYRFLSPEDEARMTAARLDQARMRRPGGTSNLTWASAHAESITRMNEESLMLTGDGELVELLATVEYTQRDPQQALFSSRDIDSLLRSVTEAVLREQTAATSFQNLLGTGRLAFEVQANTALEERLAESAPAGLGIQLHRLTIHDLHPPQDVVASYHAVADAIQKRDKALNDAKAEASRMISRAKDEALRTERAAKADAHTKLAEVNATNDVILAWIAERNQLSAAEAQAVGSDPGARQQALATKRFLIDLRLALNASVQALAKRDKILIDGDNIPGGRKLYLLDPALMPKTPVPLAFPGRGLADQ